jgi:hypothetical protein
VSTGVINTVAGTGDPMGGYNGDNIQATAATLNNPHDVVLDSFGNIYISDRDNCRIRKVDVSTGLITTVVGTGVSASTGDDSASTSATISGTCQIRFDIGGNLYISECNGARIRKATNIASPQPTQYPTLSPSSAGIITTYAGTGATGFSGATISNRPAGIDFDSSGNLYINEYVGHRTLKITIATGIITVFAGTGTPGYSGDGGAATSATLSYPNGLCLDTSGFISLILFDSLYRFTYLTPLTLSLGNVYIADWGTHFIRKVTAATSIISTIAGTGGSDSYNGDNIAATSASLCRPIGVAVDNSGKPFDDYNGK